MKDPAKLLEHKALFDRFAGRRPHELSAFHFSSIFLWQDHFDFGFEVIADHLCVWAKHAPGTFLYLPPLSDCLDANVVKTCFERLRSSQSKKGAARIENVSPEDLGSFGSVSYRTAPRSPEYLYVRGDLAALKGNAYKSKRASYNQFANHHAHEYVRYDKRWANDCLKLYDDWAERKAAVSDDDIYKAMLEDNRRVHELIFHFADELELEGRLILIDGKPQAYTFGYFLNPGIFCVLVETVNLDLKGLSVYIFSRLCADETLKDAQFINAMDDFAMANVAKTKASFNPIRLIESVTVIES